MCLKYTLSYARCLMSRLKQQPKYFVSTVNILKNLELEHLSVSTSLIFCHYHNNPFAFLTS